jgi:branched-chain amino acid transport system permease protein
VGMAISVPLSLLIGLPSLRLSGLYLALATMAFALLMDNLVFVRADVTGGVTGLMAPRPQIFGISFGSTARMYELSVIVFAIVGFVALVVHRGPVGRRLQMLRDSPVAASTLGVNLTVTKLVVFAICGAVAALGGALFGSFQQVITPLDFQFGVSLQLLLLVVLGGRSVITGAIIAGAVYTAQQLPISPRILSYIPLTVALIVIVISRAPDGAATFRIGQMRWVLALLGPRPRAVSLTPAVRSMEVPRG